MRLHRRSANYREIYPRVSDSGIFGFREWGIIGRVQFSEQLKKDGYHFLMESDDYPNRNSEYVRRYVEVMLDEDQDQ